MWDELADNAHYFSRWITRKATAGKSLPLYVKINPQMANMPVKKTERSSANNCISTSHHNGALLTPLLPPRRYGPFSLQGLHHESGACDSLQPLDGSSAEECGTVSSPVSNQRLISILTRALEITSGDSSLVHTESSAILEASHECQVGRSRLSTQEQHQAEPSRLASQ